MTLLQGLRGSAFGGEAEMLREPEQSGSTLRPSHPLYALVEEELQGVEDILRRELVSQHPNVNRLVQHGVRLGGKRLRPALLILTAKACGRVAEEHLVLAAVMEMIHTATLVHDDVLDEAMLRRHRATVNAQAGNEASVLLGDYLFSHSFYLASTLDNTFACQQIGLATNIVCQGEMRQIDAASDYGLSEAEYVDIIEAKTAELCACCCLLGAHYAGSDPRLQEQMSGYGRSLGIAFQIVDDLLDVVGVEETAGKSLGTDFDSEKLTLPLIHLLSSDGASARRQIERLAERPRAERRSALSDMLQQSGSLDYARRRAKQYADAARGYLDSLPDSPARDVLAVLPEFVTSREH